MSLADTNNTIPIILYSFNGKKTVVDTFGFHGNCKSVEEYEKLDKIGEGTYGEVFKAKNRLTGNIVALKKIRLEPEEDKNKKEKKDFKDLPAEGLPLAHFREIMLLKSLNHPNIVSVLDVCVGNQLGTIFTVMEYCTHDMAALLDSMKFPFGTSEVKCLLYQLLRGLEFLHSNFIVHRDLKLSNLLLNFEGTLKIADFGLARKFGSEKKQLTPKVCTLWYRAPELLFGEVCYSAEVDIWSVGCIFGELLLHHPLLPGSTELDQLHKIATLLGTPSVQTWPEMNSLPLFREFVLPKNMENNLWNKVPDVSNNTIDLLQQFLTYRPQSRISIHDALQHKYFQEAPKKADKKSIKIAPDMRSFNPSDGRRVVVNEDKRPSKRPNLGK